MNILKIDKKERKKIITQETVKTKKTFDENKGKNLATKYLVSKLEWM